LRSILNNITTNFPKFFTIWLIVIIVNQIFVFGACFALYCLIAAAPHTAIIAAFITFMTSEDSASDTTSSKNSEVNKSSAPLPPKLTKTEIHDDVEETDAPFCPRCGSGMELRTARRGRHAGNQFWGCESFPKCKGIVNIS
jgi:hypothetical protein